MMSKNEENVYFSNEKPKSPDPLPISVHFVPTSPLCFIGKNIKILVPLNKILDLPLDGMAQSY